MIEKIISGGQTGVDRAALDVAGKLGITHGGWCPKGRIAQDGPLDLSYALRETLSPDYAERTEWNVRDSDSTLVLHNGILSGGTALTVELVHQYDKPHLIIDLKADQGAWVVRDWMKQYELRILNVAGPRGEGNPGIYERASQFLSAALVW